MFSHWQTLNWQIFPFDQMFQYQQIKFVLPIISWTCSGHSHYSWKEVGYSTCAHTKELHNQSSGWQGYQQVSTTLVLKAASAMRLVKVVQVFTQSQPPGMGLHSRKPGLDYIHGEKISPSIHIFISIYYMQICLHCLPGKSSFAYADKLHMNCICGLTLGCCALAAGHCCPGSMHSCLRS